jgi:tetrahydromethanopterin S-methyltransferase subunit C
MSVKAVFAIVSTELQAERIAGELKSAGFSADDVSVLLPDKKESKASEGAVAGVSTGGFVGGSLGWLVGIGSLAIPGLGPFIAAGPILAALSGAAIGAAVGGFTGALVGMGIPEPEAKQYESKIRERHILMAVHTGEDGRRRERAIEILKQGGAHDIASIGYESVPPQVVDPAIAAAR